MQKLILLAALICLPMSAMSSGISITNTAFKEAEAANSAGRKVVIEVPADSVRPGDTVRFITEFKNDSDAPTNNVVLQNPLPEYVMYLDSKTGINADTEVSADGGTTWQPINLAAVETPIPQKGITHVRWIIAEALKPGESAAVSYRGIIE